MFRHIGGVFENAVGENHHTQSNWFTGDHFQRAIQNQARTWSGHQPFALAKFQCSRVSKLIFDFQNVIDQRGIEELAGAELRNIPQAGNIVAFARLHGDDFEIGIFGA